MPVSMSRHYGRGYHRRGTPVCQTSFPIDKLFKENSNRPSAARSAGTIGKWGITSFTTIRNSNYEPSYSKYSTSYRSQNKSSGGNSYSNDENKQKQEGPPKPKKFFKSRNAEVSDETVVSPPNSGTKSDPSPKSPKSPIKKSKEDVGTTSKKVYGSKTSPKSDQSSSDEYKPPIVLRIFKGTSCIVADGEKGPSPVTSPTSPKTRFSPSKLEKTVVTKQEKPSANTRSTRRRSFQESAESAPVSPRPKRARKEVIKDPAIQSIISQLISDDEGETVYKPCDISSSDKVTAQENVNQVPDDASDDSLPLACTSYFSKKETKDSEVISMDETQEKEPLTNVIENVEAEKIVKFLKDEINQVDDTIESNIKQVLEDPLPEEIKEAQPVTQTVGHPEEKEFESGSDSLDALNPCGVTLMSKVESGGLKLVIKKTPETVMSKDVKAETEEKEEDSVPAKVLPVKKKSIFKSRGKDESGNGNSKRLALYKHNWNTSQAVEVNNKETAATSASQYEDVNEFDLGGLTRVSGDLPDGGKSLEDITKVKCDRKDKGVCFMVIIKYYVL